MNRKILMCILAIAFCFVLPIFALEIILEIYLTYSSLNLSLVYIAFLAHIDVTIYFLYRHFMKNKK